VFTKGSLEYQAKIKVYLYIDHIIFLQYLHQKKEKYAGFLVRDMNKKITNHKYW